LTPNRNYKPATALLDFAIVLITIIAVKYFAGLYLWKFAGPISLLTGVVVATIILVMRGQSWAELGLRLPKGLKGWGWLPLQVILALGAFVFASLVISQIVEPYWPRLASNEDRFEGIYQNLPYFLLWLAIAIVHGGVFEELIYRGFFISRLEAVFDSVVGRTVIAIVMAGAIFGLRHMDNQGLHGVMVTGGGAIVLGVLYVMFRRNLLPLIIAHALIGILNMTVRFAVDPAA